MKVSGISFSLLSIFLLGLAVLFSCSPFEDSNGVGDVWKDPSTGLMWQAKPRLDEMASVFYGYMIWEDAENHCANLTLAEFDDWRVPTISELRSLIRGCPATETGGPCGVTDSCRNRNCFDRSCMGCSHGEGPSDGCYWPSQLSGSCDYYRYWSSTRKTGGEYVDLFCIDFGKGWVTSASLAEGINFVRCVR